MHTVAGRSIDHLLLADGRRLSPYQLTCALELVPGVARYQVVQLNPGQLQIKVIPYPSYNEQSEREIQSKLRALLGDGIDIEIRIVTELGRDSGGKFRVVMRNHDRG